MVFFPFVRQTLDIIKYMGKFTFQIHEWNTSSVDKIKELRQVVDMAFKQMSVMPSKDANAKT